MKICTEKKPNKWEIQEIILFYFTNYLNNKEQVYFNSSDLLSRLYYANSNSDLAS